MKIMVSGVDTTVNNINAAPEQAVPENVSSDHGLSPFADVFQGVSCLPGPSCLKMDSAKSLSTR